MLSSESFDRRVRSAIEQGPEQGSESESNYTNKTSQADMSDQDETTVLEKVADLTGLSPAFLEPLLLRYVADMSVREISDQLDLPKGTVKSRLSRSRTKLDTRVEDRREARSKLQEVRGEFEELPFV